MMLRKRVGAFIIDMLLVCLVAVALGDLSYLNPYKEKYKKASSQYEEVYYEYIAALSKDEGSGFTSVKDLTEYTENAVMPALRKVEKSYIFYALWYLIPYFLYFGVFTYFNNGQTLGKKLFKIKVVNKGSNELSFNRVIRRCLFNGTSLYYGINIIIILRMISTFINDIRVFNYIYYGLEFISIIIELSLVITLFVSKGKKLTNDIFAQTEIVEAK